MKEKNRQMPTEGERERERERVTYENTVSKISTIVWGTWGVANQQSC